MEKITVFQIRLKVFLLNDIRLEEMQYKIGRFIDKSFGKKEELLKLHKENKFKNYCFNGFYPNEEEKVYKKGNIYTITIRTIDRTLAEFFEKELVNEYDNNLKGLTCEIKILPKRYIEKIYTLTPVILKTDKGYWRKGLSLEDFERRLKENLIKKYNKFTEEKINENFQFYYNMTFNNELPISSNYKNIKLLGDKITLNITEEKEAQDLAYLCLGTGLLEGNSRGYGFVIFRYL